MSIWRELDAPPDRRADKIVGVFAIPFGGRRYATDFAAFCQRNPKPCPVIGMSAVGDPSLPDLGDIDIRTELPRYRVFRDGECVDEPTDVRDLWADDMVAFVLGCSFSFEAPLIEAGIPIHHIERDTGEAPFVEVLGGVAYTGDTGYLLTRINEDASAVINMPGNVLFGALSDRIATDADLTPALTASTNHK